MTVTEVRPVDAKARPSRARVGRPTAQRAEEIDRTIIEAARARFLSVGFEGVSMEAIAEAAGIGKSTLYARYANKGRLLEAVLEQQAERAGRAKLPLHAAISNDPKARLEHLALEILKAVASPEIVELRQLVQQSGAASDRLQKMLAKNSYAPARDEVAACLEQTAEAKAGPAFDARRVADMLMAMLLGWEGVHRFDERPPPLEEARTYAAHAVELLLAGRSSW